jgi:hypothetical protein
MATKKLKLEEKAIAEILVADTDLESGAEVSGVEEEFDEQEYQEEEQQQLLQQTSAEDEPQASTSCGLLYHPGDHLKEGTYMFILSSVQQTV